MGNTENIIEGTVEAISSRLKGIKIDGNWYSPEPGVSRPEDAKSLINKKVSLKLAGGPEFSSHYVDVLVDGKSVLEKTKEKPQEADKGKAAEKTEKKPEENEARKVETVISIQPARKTFKGKKSYFPESKEVELTKDQLASMLNKKVVFVPGKDRGLTLTYRRIISIDGVPVEEIWKDTKPSAEKTEKKETSTKKAAEEARPQKTSETVYRGEAPGPSADVWEKKDRRISRQVCLQRATDLVVARGLTKKADLKEVASEIVELAKIYEKYVYENLE